jgi:hypothetical protein
MIPRFFFGEEEDKLILDKQVGFTLTSVVPPPPRGRAKLGKLSVIAGGKSKDGKGK